ASPPLAVAALVPNDSALALATRTRGLQAEKTLRLHDLPVPPAIVAGLGSGPRLGPRAAAGAAMLHPLQLQRARASPRRLEQIDRDRRAEAVPLPGPAGTSAASTPAEAEPVEDIAKQVENVRNVV